MSTRSPITTHVLDTHRGKPAVGVAVALERRLSDTDWKPLARGTTSADGRVENLLAPGSTLEAGTYRLNFEVGGYFRGLKEKSFYPFVTVTFEVTEPGHYHVPLLLSAHGYTTYRGS